MQIPVKFMVMNNPYRNKVVKLLSTLCIPEKYSKRLISDSHLLLTIGDLIMMIKLVYTLKEIVFSIVIDIRVFMLNFEIISIISEDRVLQDVWCFIIKIHRGVFLRGDFY